MSRRQFVLKNARKLGLKMAVRMRKYAYAVWLSHFLKKHKDVPKFENRFGMYDHVISQFNLENKSLQYLEFGVFEGKSIKYWLSENKNDSSLFYGFDSFEGLPEDWFPGIGKGAFGVGGKLPDITDPRVNFVKGWFNKTLPDFVEHIGPDKNKQIVLHMDADLYSSTYYVLNCLYFKGYIQAGTLIIFDEVIVASIADTEFRAFMDFVEVMQLNYKVLGTSEYEMAIVIL